MKKFFLIAASAMMVFASCSKMDVNYQNDGQPQEIAFYPMAKNMTKAPVTGTTFPTNYHMSVSAYIVAGGDGVYFMGTEFEPPVSGGLWACKSLDSRPYWPMGESRINFMAVTIPDEDGSKITWTDPNTVKQQVKVTYQNATQHDLMYAANHHHRTPENKDNDVALTFKHALSCFYFTVTKSFDAEIFLQKIHINCVGAEGTLTLTNPNYNYDGFNGDDYVCNSDKVVAEWSVTDYPDVSGQAGVIQPSTEIQVQKGTVTEVNNVGHLVIPKCHPTNGVVITIFYKLNGVDCVLDTYPLDELNMGTKYTFNINFGSLTEIKISPVVTEWGDNTDVPVSGS